MREFGIEREYQGARLGDERLNARLVELGTRLSLRPDRSLPRAMGSEARLEAAYRFLNNTRVRDDALLAPHVRETRERATAHDTVLAIHDTTEFTFPGPTMRSGLGRTNGKTQGFFCHTTLLVAPGEARLPLGVLAFRSWSRSSSRRHPRVSTGKRARDPRRESIRWIEQAASVQAELAHSGVVHVMDREADFYELFWRFAAEDLRFVVRATGNRKIELVDGSAERVRVGQVAGTLPTRCTRMVPLSRRLTKKQPGRIRYHGPRQGRRAHLHFSASTVRMRRPVYAPRSAPEEVLLNMICVHEDRPPRGEQPIEWVLFTTEPIATAAEVLRVVDFYRSRWTIEEFFKALKTGCAFEQRQLESFPALRRALAIFAPIAWHLLLLRSTARASPDASLRRILHPRLILALRTVSPVRLRSGPTVREGFAAMAALGGHLRRNGEPGWQTLAAGYHLLLLIASASKTRGGCDQW